MFNNNLYDKLVEISKNLPMAKQQNGGISTKYNFTNLPNGDVAITSKDGQPVYIHNVRGKNNNYYHLTTYHNEYE